jgi:hypothetical protein
MYESISERDQRREKAKARAKQIRWNFPQLAKVIHPDYGEVYVPCASPYSAILCAADLWGCDWMNVLNAEVRRVERSVQVDH